MQQLIEGALHHVMVADVLNAEGIGYITGFLMVGISLAIVGWKLVRFIKDSKGSFDESRMDNDCGIKTDTDKKDADEDNE